ncbi:MAG: hypothetical protein JKY13_01510 [Gammaproteobacteria bacterium]|nr:hypothetical protein [Gammaproteobacteria bacterium]
MMTRVRNYRNPETRTGDMVRAVAQSIRDVSIGGLNGTLAIAGWEGFDGDSSGGDSSDARHLLVGLSLVLMLVVAVLTTAVAWNRRTNESRNGHPFF